MERTPAAQNASCPEEITIPLPQLFKDYLVPRNEFMDLRIVGTYLISLVLFFYLWKSKGSHSGYEFFITHGAIYSSAILLHFLMWQRQKNKAWAYHLSHKSITLIEWRYSGKTWVWHDLNWMREAISAVELTEWRSLPAICIHTAAKEPKNRQTLYLVYAHEDSEKIQTQILPMIEQYRLEYRHHFWAAEWNN